MADTVLQVITWGLLGMFGAFLVFGIGVAAVTLFRFYRSEFERLRIARNKLSKTTGFMHAE